MKTIITAAMFFTLTLLFVACNGNNNTKGTTETSNTSDTTSSTSATDSTRGNMVNNTAPDKESIDFVTKAASGGMMEVQLGNLAQTNAKSQRVKDFGSMMVTDHTNANDELKGLASSNNITISSSLLPEHQKHVDIMGKMKGADFDKHYMDMMLDDHKKDIEEFKKEAGSSNNDVFKNFASKTLPVLQKHLDSAKAITKKE